MFDDTIFSVPLLLMVRYLCNKNRCADSYDFGVKCTIFKRFLKLYTGVVKITKIVWGGGVEQGSFVF